MSSQTTQHNKLEIRDARNGSWAWYDKEVIASNKLTTSEKMIYISLTWFANESQKLYPSINKICQLSGRSRPVVVKSLNHLEKLGLIKKNKSAGKTTQYTLLKVKRLNSFTGVVKSVNWGSKVALPKQYSLTKHINNNKKRLIKKFSISNKIKNKTALDEAKEIRNI